MKTPRSIAGFGILAAIAVVANVPATANDSGFYVGGSAGLAKSKIDDERITSGLLASGFTTTSIEDDDHDVGYKVFGGYQFVRYFAIESGYFDLGKFSFKATTQPPGSLSGQLKLRGVNFDAVAILPFTRRFSAFGRGGVTYAETRDEFTGSGAIHVQDPERKKRAANYKFGVGLEYDFVDAFGMRLEAERYRIDDAVGNKGDIDLFSAGLVFRFGTSPPPQVAMAPPAPVVMAPPPPPPPPPAPPPPRRVTFSADSFFAFDSAVLLPAGVSALDKFTRELSGTRFDTVTVTGHTDRIGTHAYNMDLSTRRAEAVRRYLVDVARLPSEKIMASGIDGSEPVTKPGECTGREKPRASPELIACLAPDRRVEVVVTGTQQQ